MGEAKRRGATPRPRLFHGGAPGLRPGDVIEPRPPGDERHLVDGCPVCEARRVGDPSDYDRDHRFDRVYVTPNRFIARCFAAGYPSGALYQVEPVGDLETDPEHEESFAVRAARVLVVLDRCVDARFFRRGEVRRWLRMGEGF
jgi:hypothetical protein